MAVLGVGGWLAGREVHFRTLLHLGQAALDLDHCPEALDLYRSCMELRPHDASATFGAARSSRRVGDFDAAETLLNQCPPAAWLADPIELERVLLRASRGEVDSVGAYCQRLIEQGHPDELLIREALVKGFINLYRPVDALSQVAQWQQVRPGHPQAIFLHGLIDYLGSNLQVPAAKFREVLEIDPQRSDARSLLAELLLDLGQPQEALPHLEKLARERPADLTRKARLGVCLDMMGRQDEAKELLEDVLKQQPTHAIALLERGKLALRGGDLDAAESHLQQACSQSPGDHAAHYQLLQCLRRKGKAAEVQAVQKKMGQIQDDTARIREITGKQMSAAPDNPALHAELGEIFLRSGATKEGVRWLQSALRLSPLHAAAHRALAEHYQQAGQLSRAADHRRKAAGATPAPAPQDRTK